MPSATSPTLLSMTRKYVLRLTAMASAVRMLWSFTTGFIVVSTAVTTVDGAHGADPSASWTANGGAWPFKMYWSERVPAARTRRPGEVLVHRSGRVHDQEVEAGSRAD